jgi:hypothetical protein
MPSFLNLKRQVKLPRLSGGAIVARFAHGSPQEEADAARTPRLAFTDDWRIIQKPRNGRKPETRENAQDTEATSAA